MVFFFFWEAKMVLGRGEVRDGGVVSFASMWEELEGKRLLNVWR